MDTLTVVGAIGLDTFGHSQSDFYSFAGQAGQLINLEIMSQSLTRLGGSAAMTIDPVIRVFDSEGLLVPYYEDLAVNDDQHEGTDSALLDLRLPADGVYTIEVDTFRHDLIGPLPDLTNVPPEVRDAYLDTDVGQYELFVYSFGTANSMDGIDTLIGGLGDDELDGGPGESYALTLELGEPVEGITEVPFILADIPFIDRGGSSWAELLTPIRPRRR